MAAGSTLGDGYNVVAGRGTERTEGAAPHGEGETYVRGVTFSSMSVILFALLATAAMLVCGESVLGQGHHYGAHIMAIPAVAVFLAVCGAVWAVHRVLGVRWLTRAELVCIFFTLLIAVPIMGLGFWTNFIWLSSTIPVQGDFEKIDAISDRLWPHGPNLLEGRLYGPDPEGITTHGDVTWEETEYEAGKTASIPVLRSDDPNGVTWLRIRVPLEKDGDAFLTLGQRYYVSFLARGTDFGPESAAYCRVYYDGKDTFDVEAFSARPGNTVTSIHRTGFERIGVYGTEFAPTVQEYVDIEFRLIGDGRVALADPKLMCVDAYESLFRGRRTVSEAEFASMRPSERPGYVMQPDSMFSLAGLRYILTGFVPVQAWASPVLGWFSIILLYLLATFAVAAILRRQWLKNERYPLPIAQIPMALLGVNESEPEGSALPSIWRNRIMWLGFGVSLFWCLMRVWYAYDPNVPNMNINVQLRPYFEDPSWGAMWNDVAFSISAIVLALAVFIELNILMSLVIGFFLFISLHWIGEVNGWSIGSAGKFGMGAYPYADEQLIGAYLTYGLLTLFFTRKYLWRTIKQAFTGQHAVFAAETNDVSRPAEPEPFSYRTAYVLLALAIIGALAWGAWAEIDVHAMAILFGLMLLVGFVAMKLRAECGTPYGWFGSGTQVLVPLLGGIAVLGANGAMFATMTTLGMVLLFIIPGLQLEFIEIARRTRILPRHVFYCLLFGVAGGMFVGGWFFLSSMYGIGSDSSGTTTYFAARPWEFFPFDEFKRVADSQLHETQAAAGSTGDDGGMDPAMWGYIGAGGATAIVTLLRHTFPGFWFHPIGIVLAATADGFGMLRYWEMNLWGSLLAAWCIRWLTLKLGGAAAVRETLFPFFVGVFVAAISAEMVMFIVHCYHYFFEPTTTRGFVIL